MNRKPFYETLKLQFQNIRMEQEYQTLKDRSRINFFQIILCFWFSILAIFSVVLFFSNEKLIGCLFAGEMGVTVTILVYQKRSKKYTNYLLIFITFLFTLTTLVFSSTQINKDSSSLQYFRGWSFGSAHIIILIQLPKFSYRFGFLIASFGLRYGILGFLNPDIFVPEVLIENILTDAFAAYIYFYYEKKDRENFQRSFQFQNDLLKFKGLIENCLPQGILILDLSLQKSLFSNKAFERSFEQTYSEPSPQADRFEQESGSIYKNHTAVLDFLFVQRDSIRYPGASQSDSHGDSENLPNLRTFIRELRNHKLLGQSSISLTAIYDQANQRKIFEVILASLVWDKEEALAVILNDITYQEDLITLKLANGNKDFLISTISHELRTPLNAIIGILQIIESKVKQPDILEYLTFCRDNANLLLNLVNSILDFQLLHHGKLKLSASKTKIRKLLKDTLNLFSYQATQKGLCLKLHVDEIVPEYIYTDGDKLKQILINLIGNALKFTFQGEVTVDVALDPLNSHYLQFSVIDTGIGIKAELKNKLFKMYEKLHDSSRINQNGIGLGLTISNTLVQLLGNKNDEGAGIQVISQYGKGSKFWFKTLKEWKENDQTKTKENKLELSKEIEGKEVIDGDDKCNWELIDNGLKDCEESIEPADLKLKLSSHTIKKRPTFGFRNSPPRMISFSSNEEIPMIKPDKDNRSYFSKNYSQNRFQVSSESPTHRNGNHIQEKLSFQAGKGLALIVDDNPFNLMVAQNFVEDLGYAVITAMNGEEALLKVKTRCEITESTKLKFILMDCQMPVMDGYEATIKLREMMGKGEIEEVPIIALTANNTSEDIQRCLDCGMSNHLAKPLLMKNLQKCLAEFQQDNV